MSIDKLPPDSQKEFIEKMRKYLKEDRTTAVINFLEWLKTGRQKREVWIDTEKRELFKKLLGEGYTEEKYVSWAEGNHCNVTERGLKYLEELKNPSPQLEEQIANELEFLSKERIRLLEENEVLKKEIQSSRDNPVKVEVPVEKIVFEPVVLKKVGVGFRWYNARTKKYMSKDAVGLEANPNVLLPESLEGVE